MRLMNRTLQRKSRPSVKLKPEEQVQIAFMDWLALYNPEMRDCTIKIDNEGNRHIVGHMLAIASGLSQKAPDLFFMYPANGKHGLFIEVKKEGYKASGKKQKEHEEGQRAWLEKARNKGYGAYMCIGIDQCMQAIKDYLGK